MKKISCIPPDRMKRQGLLHRLRIRIPGCAAAPLFHDPDGTIDYGTAGEFRTVPGKRPDKFAVY